MGQAPNGASYNTNGDGYPLIAGAGDFGETSPRPGKWTDAPTKLSEPGDIILCIRATIGDRNWSDNKYCLGRGVAGLRAMDAKLDQKYLWQWLGHSADQLKSKGRGATFLQVSKADIASLQIPLPPLPEQKRIAGILDAAHALRAKRRESLAQLDTLLQSTFLDMFGDPVTNPMGWEIKSLGEVCDVRDGTHDSPKYVETGHPLLTSKNFKDGQIDYSGASLISDEDFLQINKRSKVDVGDLVMPMIGTIGNPVLVEDEPVFAIKNVALIKFSKESPDNRFIRALLCSHYFDHITSKANRGGTQKFVALKDLRGMPIPLPALALQRRFAAIVESVERQKARLRAHLAELDTLFASLQSRAFNGQL